MQRKEAVMASKSMDLPIAGDMTTRPGGRAGPNKVSDGAAVPPGVSATGYRGEAASPTISARGSSGFPSLAGKPAPEDQHQSLIATSLARRALRPDCVHLGGCFLGIPGLMPVPEKGDIGPIARKSKSFLERLIKGKEDAVAGYQLLPKVNAARGETYVSDRFRNSNKGGASRNVPRARSRTIPQIHGDAYPASPSVPLQKSNVRIPEKNAFAGLSKTPPNTKL